ncbi:MAG TPA: polyprenyl synthetase family protein, partial [Haloplasmataceae bacterium]
KTGKLLEFSLVAPAIISKKNSETRETLKEIGYHIGMAFQIKDDLLDVVGDKDIMGKATKRDEKNNKITYICLLGIEKANEELNKHYHKALSLLRKLDVESNLIEELFALIINRNK